MSPAERKKRFYSVYHTRVKADSRLELKRKGKILVRRYFFKLINSGLINYSCARHRVIQENQTYRL